jgi:hypothetical protein
MTVYRFCKLVVDRGELWDMTGCSSQIVQGKKRVLSSLILTRRDNERKGMHVLWLSQGWLRSVMFCDYLNSGLGLSFLVIATFIFQLYRGNKKLLFMRWCQYLFCTWPTCWVGYLLCWLNETTVHRQTCHSTQIYYPDSEPTNLCSHSLMLYASQRCSKYQCYFLCIDQNRERFPPYLRPAL